MTDKFNSPRNRTLRESEPDPERRWHARSNDDQWHAGESAQPVGSSKRRGGWRLPFNPWFLFDRRHPVVRKLSIGLLFVLTVFVLAAGGLWWRLSSGPIMLDVATPWLTSAIEQNFGDRYRVQVGGTQLERDGSGRTALRLRNIALRDRSGALVAVAPKAEVGILGTSLLSTSPRAQSFHLVDANMVIRIDADGRVNITVGGDRPFISIAPNAAAGAPALAKPAQGGGGQFSLQAMAERSLATNLAALVAWVDGLGLKDNAGGFDGQDLTEIGITNGSLAIEDDRNGQKWKLSRISLRLSRPSGGGGGAALSVVSENHERPWALNVALTPTRQGHRHLHLRANKVVLDDLLALRMAEGRLRSDTLVSASVEADIAPNGAPQRLAGTIVAQGGTIGDPDDPEHRIPISNAEFALDWDVNRGTLRLPFKINAGSARITLQSEFAAPAQAGGNWRFAIGGGWIVLDPPTASDEGLVLKRVNVRGSIDPTRQLVSLDTGDFGTKELGSKEDKDVTIAVSGKLDYGGEPRLAVGIAGNQMSAGTLKRIWPAFVAPKVRDWVADHIVGGTVDRLDIATNAPVATLQPGGPAIPNEGLSIEIVGRDATLRPVAGLPTIREADLNVRVTGRTATIVLSKGVMDVSPGRRLAISNGVFEVPDMRPTSPRARVRFKVEGGVPAAAELLALERLREFSGAPFDPASTRGTMSAQIQLAMPLRPDLPKGSTEYNIAVDLSNFSAEKTVFGHKIEAQSLRANANNQRYEIRGDVRIAGTPAQVEFRKTANEPDAEVRLQATLDEAARARLGLDFGNMVAGTLPMRLAGRLNDTEGNSVFNVEADLTSLKVDNLLPGWVKPAGRPARVAFTLVKDKNAIRFDDLLLDGQGVLAKGTVELDSNGELQSVNLPVFATSDGDKASLRADRGADGALRVMMRGDVYDGRNFVRSSMSGPSDPKVKPRNADLDLDIKIGVVAGHNGEAIRGLDLRLSRRGGKLRTFSLSAKIGRDTPLIGDIRTRVANGRPVVYFETNDAGALFRFTDVYSRMGGGKMWIAMDPPTQDSTPQDGLINVRDFVIRGEGALDRALSAAPNGGQRHNAIEFSQARADFTRLPGRMSLRDGVVRGPIIGATVEGNIDYARDEVHMRGTLVPLYGLNNMFGQIPIVGLFLGGGSNEGIFGITYEVTGSTNNPRPVVNPISAIAPGVLRKFFEFRDVNDRERAFVDPLR